MAPRGHKAALFPGQGTQGEAPGPCPGDWAPLDKVPPKIADLPAARRAPRDPPRTPRRTPAAGPPEKGPRGRPGSNEPSPVPNGPGTAEIRPLGGLPEDPRGPPCGTPPRDPRQRVPEAGPVPTRRPPCQTDLGNPPTTPKRPLGDLWATPPTTPHPGGPGLPSPVPPDHGGPWPGSPNTRELQAGQGAHDEALFADTKDQSPPLEGLPGVAEVVPGVAGAQGVRDEL